MPFLIYWQKKKSQKSYPTCFKKWNQKVLSVLRAELLTQNGTWSRDNFLVKESEILVKDLVKEFVGLIKNIK